MWIALIIGLVVIAYVVMVARTAALNKDPLQIELGNLILEMMASGADATAQKIFVVSITSRFMRSMVLDYGKQKTRLAHALTLARPHLSQLGYDQARMILRQM